METAAVRMELSDKDRDALRHALEVYLSDLRQEKPR